MAIIDHLVYAVPDLSEGIDRIEALLGVAAMFGGSHPGRGTHNALLSLGDSYLEIIAPDPEQPEPDGERPFGVSPDMRARLVTYAVRPGPGETIESLADAALAAGHDPGPIEPMSRRTPNGTELSWRLTTPTTAHDGLVPFLIDWGDTVNPAQSAPRAGRLVELAGTTATPDRVYPIIDALRLDVSATAGIGGLTAHISTDRGSTTI